MQRSDALDAIFQNLNRSDAPGLVVGVAWRGTTIYRKGFGLANVELGVANSPSIRMRIGSTSKQFACLAALLLVEEGRLDIDCSAVTYLPELRSQSTQPTLRQFMTHTGGQRCYVDLGFLSHGLMTWPKGYSLSTQASQGEVNFLPGENMIYCNGGYHLLSVAIERVSRVPFERYLKERIFEPLQMLDTESIPSDLQIQRGVATLHLPLPDGGYRRGMFPSDDVLGEGAIVSTVDDMLRWMAHLRGEKKIVGNASSWAQMLTVAEINGITNPYALGVMRHQYRGIEVMHHAGSVVGGSSQILTAPMQELDIAIMANTAAVDPTDLAYRVVDAVIGDLNLGLCEKAVPAELYGHLVNESYASPDSALVVRFVDAAGSLALSVQNGPPITLRRTDGTLRLSFERIAAGPYEIGDGQLTGVEIAPSELSISECGRREHFQRLQVLSETADNVDALLGQYRSPDLAVEAVISVLDGQPRLTIRAPSTDTVIAMKPLSRSVFAWEAIESLNPLRGVLNVIETGGVVTGFRIHTVRTRHLHFFKTAGGTAKRIELCIPD